MLYSVVIPVYNSEKTLAELYARIKNTFENIVKESFEIIFVDDFSTDFSFYEIKKIVNQDKRVKYIRLAKNHGQQKAALCGIRYACGDFIITMDDDLQHPPEEIPKLIDRITSDENVDVVIGKYDSKKHNMIRKFGTRLTDSVFNLAFGKQKELKLTSFRIMRAFVAESLSEINIFSPMVGSCILAVNGNVVNVDVHHDERKNGKSNYSFSVLIRNFMRMFLTNSDLPLRAVGWIGVIVFSMSIVLIIYYLCRYFAGGVSVSGWTTIIVLILMLNGLSLFSVGIIGKYITLIIKETQQIPQYAIKETNAKYERKSD